MKRYLDLVKFSHTIFALPFALVGFFLAVNDVRYEFEWRDLILVILCMIFARSAAMSFNRYLDRNIDKLNPRTAVREIPAGIISPKSALLFTILNILLFVVATYFINPLCFALSPLAIIIILGYSYTKRFTALCHIVLGLGLSLAPIGAYLAVSGVFDLIPVLYGIAVMFWVAGFDILYALQDADFDKSLRLKSIPVSLGERQAMMLSNAFHFLTSSIILFSAYFIGTRYPDLGYIHWIGAITFVGLLIYQHLIVKPGDLSRINMAFFKTNGIASLIFGTLLIMDFYL